MTTPSPRTAAHTFEQINWKNAEKETRIGVLQEMVAILLNRIEAEASRPKAETLDVERLRRIRNMVYEQHTHANVVLPTADAQWLLAASEPQP